MGLSDNDDPRLIHTDNIPDFEAHELFTISKIIYEHLKQINSKGISPDILLSALNHATVTFLILISEFDRSCVKNNLELFCKNLILNWGLLDKSIFTTPEDPENPAN